MYIERMKQEKKNILRFVLQYCNFPFLAGAFAFAMAVPALYLVFYKPVFARVQLMISHSAPNHMTQVILQILLCLLSTQLCHLASVLCLSRSLVEMRKGVKLFLFDKLLNVDYGFFQQHDTAFIEKHLIELPEKFSSALRTLIQNVLPYSITMILTIAWGFIKNRNLGWYLLGWVTVFWTLLILSLRQLNKTHKKLGISQLNQADIVTENIRNVSVNIIFPDSFRMNREIFINSINEESSLFARTVMFVGGYRCVFGMFNCLFLCGLLYFVLSPNFAYMIADPKSALLLLDYSKTMVSAIWDVMTNSIPLTDILQSLTVFSEFVNLPEVANDGMPIESINTIEIKHLNYSYGTKQVFRNFNCFMKVGDIVRLKGASGSGKSTILNLILGLLKAPDSVFINGIESSKISRESLLRKVSVLTQGDLLFHDSIENNIRRGNYNISSYELNEIMESCRLNLPLNHDCGFKNSHISFGQAKCIALCRGLAKLGVDVIILDEPFAGCDPDMIEKAKVSIRKLDHSNRIIIISDHTDNADTIANKIITIGAII